MRSSTALLWTLLSELARQSYAIPSPEQLGGLTILAYDDLDTNHSSTTSAAILLNRPKQSTAAESACHELGELLWSPGLQKFNAGLNSSLSFQVFAGNFPSSQLFWIAPASPHQSSACRAIDVHGNIHSISCNTKLPGLCTQGAPASSKTTTNATVRFQVAHKVGEQVLTGYRDFYSWRFLGIRFAKQPERFTYSKLYDATGSASALQPQAECVQPPGNGSEDCLFLNVWAPYLPSRGFEKEPRLKPVMVYIYGGGFTTGSASDATSDGGNWAQRGDVVSVNLAYRLGALGFLPLNDGVHNGNYFISDLLNGLQWVHKYIRDFGGDPSRITIAGESAGAASVNALLASPKAKGLFSAAILQSNPGAPYTPFFQSYAPVSDVYKLQTVPVLNETGCTNAVDRLACLRAFDANTLVTLPTTVNYPTLDGTYIVTPELIVNKAGFAPHIPILAGINRDEGGVLNTYPNTTNLTEAIIARSKDAGFDLTAVALSGAFPAATGSNATLNIFNATTRLSTDGNFRCAMQAQAYSAARHNAFSAEYFYEFNRTYQDPGYDTNAPVCDAPKTPSHPYGDPNMEYFKCHSADLRFSFGNMIRSGFHDRDGLDVPFSQLIVDYWTSFARSHDPNPDPAYLKARGYANTLAQMKKTGRWAKVNAQSPKMMGLQWNGGMLPFKDELQCRVLGVPENYFESH